MRIDTYRNMLDEISIYVNFNLKYHFTNKQVNPEITSKGSATKPYPTDKPQHAT